MTFPLEIGVVGLGRTGWRNHLQNLRKLPEHFRVTAVVDPMASRRQEAEAQFQCRSYSDIDGMLREGAPQWVVIATPTTLHREQASAALEAGAHVICEKPLAPTLREAEELIECAARNQRWLTVFHQNRYTADFAKVREIVDSGILGRIFLIRSTWSSFTRRWDWQTLKKFGGGNLNNVGPHALDQLLQLLGDQELEVSCQMDRILSAGDADDHVKILLRGTNGLVVDLELSSADAIGDLRWKVYGSTGGLAGTTEHLNWKYFDPSKVVDLRVDERAPADRSYNSEALPWKEGAWQKSRETESAHLLYYKNLCEQLARGCPPQITATDALRVLSITEKCRRVAGIDFTQLSR